MLPDGGENTESKDGGIHISLASRGIGLRGVGRIGERCHTAGCHNSRTG
jgi:hypothetical protein